MNNGDHLITEARERRLLRESRRSAQRTVRDDLLSTVQKHNVHTPNVTEDNSSTSGRVQQLRQKEHDTTHQILRTVAESKCVGADSLIYLKKQRDQLGQIDDELAEIDDTLTRSQRILNGMESLTKTFTNLFRTKPEPTASVVKRNRDAFLANEEKNNEQDLRRQPFKRTTAANDPDLDEVLKGVQDMRLIAEDMNSELTLHQKLITRIDGRMDIVEEKTKKANLTMHNILHG